MEEGREERRREEKKDGSGSRKTDGRVVSPCLLTRLICL